MAARLLRGFAYLWLSAVGALIVGDFMVTWHAAGVDRALEVFNPLDIDDALAAAIVLSPGLGAYALAKLLGRRSEKPVEQRSGHDAAAKGESRVVASKEYVVAVDEAELPAPKERIKGALLLALCYTSEPEMQRALTEAYTRLADFQPGVGSTPITFPVPRVPHKPTREEVLWTMERIFRTRPDVREWMIVTLGEHEQLVEELKAAGYGRNGG